MDTQNHEQSIGELVEKAMQLFQSLPTPIKNGILTQKQLQASHTESDWSEHLKVLTQINRARKEALYLQLYKPEEPKKPLNPITEGLATTILVVIVIAVLSWIVGFSLVKALPIALVAGIIAFFVKNRTYFDDKQKYADVKKNYDDEFSVYQRMMDLRNTISQLPNMDLLEKFVSPLMQVLKSDFHEKHEIALLANFQAHKLANQKSGTKDTYKHPRMVSLQTDLWEYPLFELSAKLSNKINLQIQLKDSYRQRNISKRGVSGKIKHTSKHKFSIQTAIQATMSNEVFEEMKKSQTPQKKPAFLQIETKEQDGKKTISLKAVETAVSSSLIDTEYMPSLPNMLKNLTYLFSS